MKEKAARVDEGEAEPELHVAACRCMSLHVSDVSSMGHEKILRGKYTQPFCMAPGFSAQSIRAGLVPALLSPFVESSGFCRLRNMSQEHTEYIQSTLVQFRKVDVRALREGSASL